MSPASDTDTPEVQIADLRREDGFWAAVMTVDGHDVRVDTRFGSWRVAVDPSPEHPAGASRELLALWPARLQAMITKRTQASAGAD